MVGRVQVAGMGQSFGTLVSKLSLSLGAAGGCVWEDVKLGLHEPYMLNLSVLQSTYDRSSHLSPGPLD